MVKKENTDVCTKTIELNSISIDNSSFFNISIATLLIQANNNLIAQYVSLQNKQEETINLISNSTAEIISLNKIESNRIIELQKQELKELTLKSEKQTEMLCFLQQEEKERKEAALQLLDRKARKKSQKKKAVRDAATLPEFKESISIINNKKYRCEFVRSRDKIALLVLFLTGIRVSNLVEITASNLQCLLSDEKQVYFQVNLIKSRKRAVYSTLLTKLSLEISKEYKNDVLRLLQDKEPTEYVFTCKGGSRPLERAALTKKLNQILKVAGKAFGKNLSSHSFRIGQVTLLVDQFGLLNAQKLIGHQNVETTLRYARNKLGTDELSSKMLKVDKQKYEKISRHKLSNQVKK